MLQELLSLWSRKLKGKKANLSLFSLLLLTFGLFTFQYGLPYIEKLYSNTQKTNQVLEQLNDKITKVNNSLSKLPDTAYVKNAIIESEDRTYHRQDKQWSIYFRFNKKVNQEVLQQLIELQQQSHGVIPDTFPPSQPVVINIDGDKYKITEGSLSKIN